MLRSEMAWSSASCRCTSPLPCIIAHPSSNSTKPACSSPPACDDCRPILQIHADDVGALKTLYSHLHHDLSHAGPADEVSDSILFRNHVKTYSASASSASTSSFLTFLARTFLAGFTSSSSSSSFVALVLRLRAVCLVRGPAGPEEPSSSSLATMVSFFSFW